MTSYIDRLPDEVIVEIILRLPMVDILHCRMVSVRLNLIIQNSTAIQYKIELAANGFVACPDNKLTSAASIRLLKEQQAAWWRCEWKQERVAQILPGYCAYDYCNGILALGRRHGSEILGPLPTTYSTTITCFQVASTAVSDQQVRVWSFNFGFVIRDFVINPLADVLILVEQIPMSLITSIPFRIHIRKLSNGDPHEMAAKHMFNFEANPLDPCEYSIRVRVQDSYIGVLIRCEDPDGSDYLSVWNWRTGEKQLQMYAEEYSFEDFIFLDTRSVMLAVNGATVTLQIWCFDKALVFHVGSFALPPVIEYTAYSNMQFGGGPLPSTPQSLDGFPFAPIPETKVLAVSFGAVETDTYDTLESYTIVMRLNFMFDALGMLACSHKLFLCDQCTPVGTGKALEWDAWGPECTRWISHGRQILKWKPCLVGGRLAINTYSDISLPGPMTSLFPVIRVYDFRPEIVARCAQSHPQEVNTDDTVMPRDNIFQEDIFSSLPYHVATSKTLRHEMSGLMMDQGRLVCLKAERDDEWRTVSIYRF